MIKKRIRFKYLFIAAYRYPIDIRFRLTSGKMRIQFLIKRLSPNKKIQVLKCSMVFNIYICITKLVNGFSGSIDVGIVKSAFSLNEDILCVCTDGFTVEWHRQMLLYH